MRELTGKAQDLSKRKDAIPDLFHRVSHDSLSRVGFHSKEKLESRLLVIEECWAAVQQHGGIGVGAKSLGDHDPQRR